MSKEYIEKETLKAQFAADGWLHEKLRASAYCKATKLGYVRERTIEQVIDCIPPADVKPVVRGEWELVDEAEPRRYGCSRCKRLSWDESNFCPNCGCDMRKEKDDE